MQHGQVLEKPQSNSLKLVTRQERSQCVKTDSQDSMQPGTPRYCLWPLPWTLTEGAGNNPDSLMLWGGATLCDGKLAGVQESFVSSMSAKLLHHLTFTSAHFRISDPATVDLPLPKWILSFRSPRRCMVN